MKNLILICIFCIFNFVASSQDITISFNAKSDTVTIDSIHVLNLRTNQTVKLSENQNLILVNTSTNLDVIPSDNGNLKVYPNPTREYANLTFNLPSSQNVVINLYNISGQLLLRQTHFLHSGIHLFRVNLPVSGMYHLSVGTENGLLNSKVLYFGDQTGSTDIKYTGSESYDITNNQLKSGTSGLQNNTLEYKPGDVIHFTVYSGENITLISDTPTKSTSIEVEFFECIDPDRKSYKTVQIGEQVWMAENLAYLPSVNPSSQGLETASYYYVYGYQGTVVADAKAANNYSTYGVLYNWSAALTTCPSGWHLPTDDEWTQLDNYLADNGYNYDNTVGGGRNKIAKTLATTTLWNTSSNNGAIGNNLSGNNKSGLSTLPGGFRFFDEGAFYAVGEFCFFWSSSEHENHSAWNRGLNYGFALVGRANANKGFGYSVRCVRD